MVQGTGPKATDRESETTGTLSFQKTVRGKLKSYSASQKTFQAFFGFVVSALMIVTVGNTRPTTDRGVP
ncbi:hypothetical protein EVAR_14094_1 [Eumeta japonica]|uniref:Uncharacterized protein n=1 Tax=Eumeta variegata TaxID=151549 RepID=A0A4C1UPY5_EUMVA|nr:hypothetical protein EVAR_14094_1 [Eumeta japonica]